MTPKVVNLIKEHYSHFTDGTLKYPISILEGFTIKVMEQKE
jgi:hypothetical protein